MNGLCFCLDFFLLSDIVFFRHVLHIKDEYRVAGAADPGTGREPGVVDVSLGLIFLVDTLLVEAGGDGVPAGLGGVVAVPREVLVFQIVFRTRSAEVVDADFLNGCVSGKELISCQHSALSGTFLII